ncbi:MAG: hypothetical protein APG12_00855 [Candidatus Methanofastidiosum methylothiophilum]|uniref:Uncharacterized protein n=1 Tax=Candidatus Methanofastidiosum methylothiophilum TaxID=1705564 RepID=A0A150IHI9_9EURY|nr:MAG: hypothetical protein APG10_01690 [Candidatus Methanofastidiosum methylthiophilus]KYC46960.1 MAG: hypothetical protein APG11_01555 [Candidatus Methanofastidiosum methylthiophilus]KYC50327.1 MAG: hypothetical protein APG12_00855 [Candidatus Methanofastidiosum methylthiophilus]
MNYKLLLGCLCIGSGLSVLYYRFTNAFYFEFLDIIVLAISLAAGIYLISKGREESKKLKE